VTNWKKDLDALIESAMAFAKEVRRQPIPDLPVALRTAEPALAETPKPIPRPATITPIVSPASERNEILQHVTNFKAHQQKMAREREDYYLQMKARMTTPNAFISLKKNPPA
jgi:hypothetical protein